MSRSSNLSLRLAGALGLLALQGCVVVGRDYEPPTPDVLPDVWYDQVTDSLSGGEANLQTWWRLLEDPVLDELMARVAPGNLDLELAFARVQEARARRGIATGVRYPDVNGNGSATRSRFSESTLPDGAYPDRREWFYDASVNATWELDLWGRVTRLIEAEDASMQASVESYRDLLVVLYADVAINYVEVRALQDRLEYARANVRAQEGTLKFTSDRFETGIAPPLDVAQAELNLANTRTLIPSLELALGQTMNRLAVLIGEAPGAVHDLLEERRGIPSPPTEIATGIPADLLRQRADVRAAERQLAAQTALVGVAEGDLYPTFNLLGSLGYEGYAAPFDSDNHVWSFGPSIRWNLFDGGRVRNNILAQEAVTRQALASYEQTVLLALEDVESSMIGYVKEGELRDEYVKSVAAAERAVELSTAAYREGVTDFQDVLDAQRSLSLSQDDLAASSGRVTQNLIRLYRALGGGWDPDPPELEAELKDAAENGEAKF